MNFHLWIVDSPLRYTPYLPKPLLYAAGAPAAPLEEPDEQKPPWKKANYQRRIANGSEDAGSTIDTNQMSNCQSDYTREPIRAESNGQL